MERSCSLQRTRHKGTVASLSSVDKITNCGKLKTYSCRGVAQPGSAPALGAGGPEFKSRRPDQKYLACFLLLIGSAVHLKPRLWNSGRQECLIRKSFSFLEFAT